MPVIPAPGAYTHSAGPTRFTSLATPSRGASETSIWRVEIAPGAPAVPHQVTHEEIFVLLSGTASVRIGDEAGEAREGDAIVVPPDTTFELSNPSAEPLVALCCLPVGGQARLPDGSVFVPPWAS